MPEGERRRGLAGARRGHQHHRRPRPGVGERARVEHQQLAVARLDGRERQDRRERWTSRAARRLRPAAPRARAASRTAGSSSSTTSTTRDGDDGRIGSQAAVPCTSGLPSRASAAPDPATTTSTRVPMSSSSTRPPIVVHRGSVGALPRLDSAAASDGALDATGDPPPMELADYLRIARRHWLGIAIIVAAVVSLAGVYTADPAQGVRRRRGRLRRHRSGRQPGPELGQRLAGQVPRRQLRQDRHESRHGRGGGRRARPGRQPVLAWWVRSRSSSPRTRSTSRSRRARPRRWRPSSSPTRGCWPWPTRSREIEDPQGRERAGTPQVRPVESAELPTAPVSPDPVRNLALGAALGLLLAFGYAMLRNTLDKRLRTPEDIESKFGVSVVGSVPVAQVLKRDAGEAAAPGRRRVDGERGKRAVVRGVPQAADQPDVHGRRQPAAGRRDDQPAARRRQVDGGRQPGCRHRVVGPAGGAGRRRPASAHRGDVVRAGRGRRTHRRARRTGSRWRRRCRRPPDHPGLKVLAAGSIPPNPSELLGSQAMRQLLQKLSSDALVLVDAPPLLPVTDAAVLAANADGAFVVVSVRQDPGHAARGRSAEPRCRRRQSRWA